MDIANPINLKFLEYFLLKNPLTMPIMKEYIKFKILIVLES
jgi:hypothetical protein